MVDIWEEVLGRGEGIYFLAWRSCEPEQGKLETWNWGLGVIFLQVFFEPVTLDEFVERKYGERKAGHRGEE